MERDSIDHPPYFAPARSRRLARPDIRLLSLSVLAARRDAATNWSASGSRTAAPAAAQCRALKLHDESFRRRGVEPQMVDLDVRVDLVERHLKDSRT